MSRLLPIAVLIAGFLAGSAFAQQPVARLITSGRPISVKPSIPVEPNEIEKRAFDQTNVVRVKNGLTPFVWDSDICRMARTHSENMSRQNYFSHVTPDGLRLRERARAAGISQYSVLGENIAYTQGYEDPAAFIVEQWMQSAKHRANILSSEFRAMAIGSFVAPDGSVYLTQTFITR